MAEMQTQENSGRRDSDGGGKNRFLSFTTTILLTAERDGSRFRNAAGSAPQHDDRAFCCLGGEHKERDLSEVISAAAWESHSSLTTKGIMHWGNKSTTEVELFILKCSFTKEEADT